MHVCVLLLQPTLEVFEKNLHFFPYILATLPDFLELRRPPSTYASEALKCGYSE